MERIRIKITLSLAYSVSPESPEWGRPRQLLFEVAALYNSFKSFWCCHRTDLEAYSTLEGHLNIFWVHQEPEP